MRWGRPTKNKKRYDPRYFLQEGRIEENVQPGRDLTYLVKAEKIKSFTHARHILIDLEVAGGTEVGYGPPIRLGQKAQEQFTEVLKYLGKNADNIAKSIKEKVVMQELRASLGRINTPNKQQRETAVSVGDAIFRLFLKDNPDF